MKYIIEINNLKKSYGNVKAVDGISFKVEKGSLFAFLGVNGAGKSTTINILCSILKKDAGEIFVDGLNLDEKKDEIKAMIGVVFQNSALDGTLSVKDNLSIRAGFYGLKGQAWKKRLQELSSLLDLDGILDKPIKNLSGGQRRRVDIARGLINYPKILILDEPTTGLDPQTRLKIWELIENLRISQKMTVFLTTHYMEEANKADMVVMIDKGHVVAKDTPHNLKTKFSSDYIKVYMERNEKFEEDFAQFKKSEKEDDFECEMNYFGDFYRINVKNSKQALEIINKFSNYITDFEVLKGDMDDVFLNITGKRLAEHNDTNS